MSPFFTLLLISLPVWLAVCLACWPRPGRPAAPRNSSRKDVA